MDGSFKIKECPIANKDHRREKRLYAHVDHCKGTICIAEDIWGLPGEHFYGIFAHEIGHLISPKKGEKDANEAMLREYGIEVKYKDSEYGKNLEYLEPEDIKRFQELFTMD